MTFRTELFIELRHEEKTGKYFVEYRRDAIGTIAETEISKKEAEKLQIELNLFIKQN